MEGMKKAFKSLVGVHEGKKLLLRPRHRRENTMKTTLVETEFMLI
jgi:hypothetical protein